MRGGFWPLVVLVLALPFSDGAAQSSTDVAEVEAVVREFVAGWRDGDSERLSAVLAPSGAVFWPAADTSTPINSQRFEEVLKNRRPQEVYELIAIHSIDVVDGILAVAKVGIRWRAGTYIDYYYLHKVEGRWWVTSKAFVTRREPGPETSDSASEPRGASDEYHRTVVEDPYRALEQTRAPEVLGWIREQDRRARDHLTGLATRQEVRTLLQSLIPRDPPSPPLRAGEVEFSWVGRAEAGSPSLAVRHRSESEAQILLTPSDSSSGIGAIAPSPGGTFVAFFEYGVDPFPLVGLLEVSSGRIVDDSWVAGTWFAQSYDPTDIVWRSDESGFYYVARGSDFRRDGSPQYTQVRFRSVAGASADDELVIEIPGSTTDVISSLALDEELNQLVLHVTEGSSSHNRVLILPLSTRVPIRLFEADAAYAYEFRLEDALYFSTTLDAPKGRLVGVSLDAPDRLIEAIPESDAALQAFYRVGDRLLGHYVEAQSPRLRLFELTGKGGKTIATLPAGGSFIGLRDQPGDPELSLVQRTLFDPGTPIVLNADQGTLTPAGTKRLAWRPEDFTVRRVEYPGLDGVAVPMYLAHRADLVLDGENPVWMSAYGAFGVPRGASYAPFRMAWMMSGGIIAIPGTRGGGDKGAGWHEQGRGIHKQNTFDDMIAAAEWMIGSGYTKPGRIALFGFSAGGLVPPVLLNQRPDLFGAAIAANPMTDLIRAGHFTGGARWDAEFGDNDDPAEFAAKLRYSPYHNIRAGCRPRTLVVAGEQDATAVPAHAYKYVAAHQAAQTCPEEPILLWMDWGGGHGVGPEKQIDYYTDLLSFAGAGVGLASWAPAVLAH